MHIRRLYAPLVALIALACSHESATAPAAQVVASIDLTADRTSLLVSQTAQLSASARDVTGAAMASIVIAFASDNAAVATVTPSGTVTAVAAGTATISASGSGKTTALTFTVSVPPPAPVASVVVAPSSLSLTAGGTSQLTDTLKDAGGSVLAGRAVSWSSSNAASATVSAAGLVTALSAGSATITATSEGKSATSHVTVTAAVPNNVIQAGPTRTYKTPCAAIAAAHAGDTIEIDAGTYAGDVCTITTANLTLRGVGGRPKLDAAGKSAQGKAIWVTHNANTTVENIEFANAVVADDNGAGIKHEIGNLTIRNCYFNNNQMGVLTGADATGDVVIESSEFAFSGNTPNPGYMHNIYIGAMRSFTLRDSYSHDVYQGNLVKSRAHTNYILYNRITGESSTDSYELDLPNGGRSFVIGNIIQQGANSPNHSIIEYGAEGIPAGYATELFVVNNTIVNEQSTGTFVNVASAVTTPAVLRNNIFAGHGTITTQATAVLESNHTDAAGDPLFVNRAAFDYHLRAGSPAIDKGVAPGSAFGVDLTPVAEYVHPRQSVPRATHGAAIDRGAYEYVP